MVSSPPRLILFVIRASIVLKQVLCPEEDMRAILIPTLVLSCAPATVRGGDSQPPYSVGVEEQVKMRFERADKDHDGKLTREEAKEGMPRVHTHFDRIDHARKGYLTLEDILKGLRHPEVRPAKGCSAGAPLPSPASRGRRSAAPESTGSAPVLNGVEQ